MRPGAVIGTSSSTSSEPSASICDALVNGLRRCGIVVSCLALLSGCGTNGHPSADRSFTPSHAILDGQHSFFDVAWLPNGWLVLNRSGPSVFDNAESLWRVNADGSGLAQLPLPTSSSKCRRFSYLG